MAQTSWSQKEYFISTTMAMPRTISFGAMRIIDISFRSIVSMFILSYGLGKNSGSDLESLELRDLIPKWNEVLEFDS